MNKQTETHTNRITNRQRREQTDIRTDKGRKLIHKQTVVQINKLRDKLNKKTGG